MNERKTVMSRLMRSYQLRNYLWSLPLLLVLQASTAAVVPTVSMSSMATDPGSPRTIVADTVNGQQTTRNGNRDNRGTTPPSAPAGNPQMAMITVVTEPPTIYREKRELEQPFVKQRHGGG